MNNYVLYPLLFSVSLLSACGDDGFTSTPVTVTAQSGGKVALTGTWKSACYSNGTNDVIDIRSYTVNGRLTGSTENYISNNSTCTDLSSTETYATDVRITVGDDKTAKGWLDGSGVADSTPSGLSATPTVSKYLYTNDSSSIIKSIDLIDDSTSSWIMYVADTTNSGDVDTEGYHDYLSTKYYLTKQ